MKLLLVVYSTLLGLVSAAPLPGWKEPSSVATPLKSESYRPFGTHTSEKEKQRLVKEIMEAEAWETYDGVYLGGEEQKLY